MKNESHSFTTAMQTLSSIAQLELEGPVAIEEMHEHTVHGYSLSYRSIHWLHQDNAEKVVRVVKETFRVVLGYLKHFYRKEFGHLSEHNAYENIQNIMSLVSEAAKKLDKFSKRLQGTHSESVKETKEFQELSAFYERKVAPITAQESLLSSVKMLPVKAVIDATKKEMTEQQLAIQHAYVDLEAVKNDSEYELFHIRKEDGTRFFSPRLVQSLETLFHLDEHIHEKGSEELYHLFEKSHDDMAREHARAVLLHCHEPIDTFIKGLHRRLDDQHSQLLYQSIEALLLAAHLPHVHTLSAKGTHGYFLDFQRFLRQALPMQGNSELKNKFIDALFTGCHVARDYTPFMQPLVLMAGTSIDAQSDVFASHLLELYNALHTACHNLAHAPLRKVRAALDDMELRSYDPYLMQNVPALLYELHLPGKCVNVFKMPSPTSQSYIHKAEITPEFREFLRALGNKKYLLFNLQDRTSWKEYARSHTLEECMKGTSNLSVVTMTKDSEFYHQVGPYGQLNQADVFIEQLLEHISSETSGYFYPEAIKNILFPQFAKDLAHTIHELFFQSKNALPRRDRLDFIELFYLLIQLKIVDVVRPDAMSFSCKDGLDVGLTNSIECLLVAKLLSGQNLTQSDVKSLTLMLFGLPLLLRGRNLFSDRFHRLLNVLKLMEAVSQEQGKKEFLLALVSRLAPLMETDVSAVI